MASELGSSGPTPYTVARPVQDNLEAVSREVDPIRLGQFKLHKAQQALHKRSSRRSGKLSRPCVHKKPTERSTEESSLRAINLWCRAWIVAPVVEEGATSEKRHEEKRADAFNREYIEIKRNGEVGSASPPAVVGKAEHHTRHVLDISLPWQA